MSGLIRWTPVSDLLSLHNAMDRLFGETFGVSGNPARWRPSGRGTCPSRATFHQKAAQQGGFLLLDRPLAPGDRDLDRPLARAVEVSEEDPLPASELKLPFPDGDGL